MAATVAQNTAARYNAAKAKGQTLGKGGLWAAMGLKGAAERRYQKVTGKVAPTPATKAVAAPKDGPTAGEVWGGTFPEVSVSPSSDSNNEQGSSMILIVAAVALFFILSKK